MTFRTMAMLALALVGPACGSNNNNGNNDAGNTNQITISAYTFTPTDLQVSPGTTITVVNADSVPHSATSQSTAGAFTPGAVQGISFDTGAFSGTASITIPASATVGTVIPYYCQVHTNMMANQPTITIKAP